LDDSSFFATKLVNMYHSIYINNIIQCAKLSCIHIIIYYFMLLGFAFKIMNFIDYIKLNVYVRIILILVLIFITSYLFIFRLIMWMEPSCLSLISIKSFLLLWNHYIYLNWRKNLIFC